MTDIQIRELFCNRLFLDMLEEEVTHRCKDVLTEILQDQRDNLTEAIRKLNK